MNNRPTFIIIVMIFFVFAMAGFWSLAHWSSPERSFEASSRIIASENKLKLLNFKSNSGGNSLISSKKLALKSPEKKHEWFGHARQEQYEGRTYLISHDFYALPDDLYQNDGEVVENANGWVYFKDTKSQTRGYKLWRDVNNKAIFMATDRIFIHLRPYAQIEDLLFHYDLEVVYKAPGPKLYLVKALSQRSPLEIIDDLKMEDAVKKVELELIGAAPEPR